MNWKHMNLHPVSMTEIIISLAARETELLLTRTEAARILRI